MMRFEHRRSRACSTPCQDLADLTGTTIETCIRLMSRWGKESIVATEKEGFRLLDREALERLVGG